MYSTTCNETNIELVSEYINNTDGLPVLTNDEKLKCEGGFTLNECFECLKFFKSNKSPGSDGLFFHVGHKKGKDDTL